MYSIFLCCTNFVYSLSWQVLKDGGRGSRALRGYFVGGAREGYFHSTRTSPESVVRQFGDTGGRFFVGVVAHRERRSGREEERR
jgi:hypothetical protein